MSTLNVKVVAGVYGPSLYIEGHRTAGEKPWGGGSVIVEFEVEESDLRRVFDRAVLHASPEAAAAARAGLSESDMAHAIHEAFHWGPPLLSCMTKHRVKARSILAALAATPPTPAVERWKCQRCGVYGDEHDPADHPFYDHTLPDPALAATPPAPAVDNTTTALVSAGSLAVAISKDEFVKDALHEADEAAGGSSCHPHCACARAAVRLMTALATPPTPKHEHDFRVWNNQADPARRVCQSQPCPGGFNPDPDKPATPPAPAVERCGFVWGPDSGAECGRLRDDERHTDEGYFLFHPFTPTPERLLDAIEAQAIGEVEA